MADKKNSRGILSFIGGIFYFFARRQAIGPKHGFGYVRESVYDPAWESFLDACASGHSSQALEEGLSNGWHLNSWREMNHSRMTAVHLAVMAPCYVALDMLLRAGAPMDIAMPMDGVEATPLAVAARHGLHESMDILISHGAELYPKHGLSALDTACYAGRHDTVNFILAREPLMRGKSSTKKANTALAWACHGQASKGMSVCVKIMLSLGASPNTKGSGGDRVIFWACNGGDLATVKALMDAGAKTTVKRSNDGSSVFMWAARNLGNDHRIAALVAQAGSRVDGMRDDGRTSIMFAAHGGMIECLDMALSGGGEPRARDSNGETALHFAALSGSLACVERLLALNVALDAVDKSGQTPMWRAAQVDSVEIFQALALAGADPLAGYAYDNPKSMANSSFALACANGWVNELESCLARGLKPRVAAGEGPRIVAFAETLNPQVAQRFGSYMTAMSDQSELHDLMASNQAPIAPSMRL
jgi:ankyrin repeat protein